MDKPRVRKYGARGILMQWDNLISPEINNQVACTAEFLRENHSDGILEIVPSYQSLLIFLKEHADLEEHIAILRYVNTPILQHSNDGQIWQVPVCYDQAFGYDLEPISATTNLSVEDIIRIHSQTEYRIYGMGFLPGFLYLGGLNEQIHFSRKSTISQLVPKGSVAIGGKQTGIYPQKSPGGWNIIGKTPIELFDIELDVPTLFHVGDSIRFVPVDLEEFTEIQSLVNEKKYQLRSITND